MMKFFLPFWPADRIFENFDPWDETWKGRYTYIWETFPSPPVDGILVSRINLEKHKTINNEIRKSNIRSFLKFSGTIMGDCGAFGYINEDKPPYDPIETLKFYRDLGFDIGVTVDHLIVPATYGQKEFRWELTLENARKMFDEVQGDEYTNFRLLGVAQGWDIGSYKKAIAALIDYGFDFIGIGGLVRRPTSFIEKLLLEVGSLLKDFKKRNKKRVDIHIFGITRESLFPLMMKVGVSSFDSASFLRRAWIAAEKNYHLDNDSYTAIRFPISKDASGKMKEGQIFGALRQFEEEKINLKDLLTLFEDYDPERMQKFGEEYERTLQSRPWKKCGCTICNNIGIHVCIFRMSERNMRRGFHNVFQFYKKFRREYSRLFVFGMCSAKKNETPSPMPAFERYLPSPLFKVFWNNVFDLPIEIGVLSAKFGLIDWSKRIPDYDYKVQESDVPRFVEELKEKLRRYDKTFFIGLGLYRDIVQRVKDEIGYNIEIFPKQELTERKKIDVIEYTKQVKLFRKAIIQAISEKCGPSSRGDSTKPQLTLKNS